MAMIITSHGTISKSMIKRQKTKTSNREIYHTIAQQVILASMLMTKRFLDSNVGGLYKNVIHIKLNQWKHKT